MGLVLIIVIVLVLISLTGGSATVLGNKRRKTSYSTKNNMFNTFEANKRVWQFNTKQTILIPYYKYYETYNVFPFLSNFDETKHFLINSGIKHNDAQEIIDHLILLESKILSVWEIQQQLLLQSFDKTRISPTMQGLQFLLQYYNYWLNSFMQLMIERFNNKILVAVIGKALNHDPRIVVSENSFDEAIDREFNFICSNFASLTNKIIEQLFIDLNMNSNQNNYYEYQKNNSNYSYQEEFDEIKIAYKTLEINENCTNDEVKKAYRSLAMKYHPDKNPSEDAKDKMSKINSAYELIKKIRNM